VQLNRILRARWTSTAKPGYDPVELFLNPKIALLKLKNYKATAKETLPAAADGCDSARRNAGERFARPAAG